MNSRTKAIVLFTTCGPHILSEYRAWGSHPAAAGRAGVANRLVHGNRLGRKGEKLHLPIAIRQDGVSDDLSVMKLRAVRAISFIPRAYRKVRPVLYYPSTYESIFFRFDPERVPYLECGFVTVVVRLTIRSSLSLFSRTLPGET